MSNILIIDDDNNSINFWQQKLKLETLDQKKQHILQLDGIKTIKKAHTKPYPDCIFYNGDINKHLNNIKILHNIFPGTPVFFNTSL